MTDDAGCILIISGSVGVGKSAVAEEISTILSRNNISHLYIDFDALTQSLPHAPGDRFGTRFGLLCLSDIWKRHVDAARGKRLVIAGVVENRGDVAQIEHAIGGVRSTVIRLTAPIATLQERLRRRMHGSGLDWHLNRAVELSDQLPTSGVDDIVIQTGERAVTDIAQDCLDQANWLASL